jgi:hypothetical protein
MPHGEGWLAAQASRSKGWLVAQKDLLQTIQAALTIAAIIVGGWWTYRLFVEQREAYPHLKIDQTVTSKALLQGVSWIHLTVNIENTGKSLVSLHSAEVRVQQILPLDPSIQKPLTHGQDLVPQGQRQVLWPLLQRSLTTLDMQLEPGEPDKVEFDFVLPDAIKTVRVYSYFENADESTNKRQIGWSCETIFDIKSDTIPGKDNGGSGGSVDSNAVLRSVTH